MWHLLNPETLQQAFSATMFGRWDQLEKLKEGQFLARRDATGKEKWFHVTLPKETIQDFIQNSDKQKILQMGVFIGEWKEKYHEFSLSVGGLFVLSQFFHPIAIARHENSFLAGKITTAANPKEVARLTENKLVAVSSKNEVLLGLARVKTLVNSNDVFLEPSWTIKTSFQEEWREKRRTTKKNR